MLDRAVSLLHSGGYTCVLCSPDCTLTNTKSGIVPLMELLEQHHKLPDGCLADKIIGKAAAMLLLLLQVKGVYGDVMSTEACDILTSAGIEVRYGTLVPMIINRQGTGACPMEQAVAELTDPADAPAAIRATLTRLQANQK